MAYINCKCTDDQQILALEIKKMQHNQIGKYKKMPSVFLAYNGLCRKTILAP